MKALISISVISAAIAVLAFSANVQALDIDDRIIELSAHQSDVFETYLQGDEIKIQARDGAVTLTGVVAEESHKSMAQETVEGLPGVTSVDNRLEIRGAPSTSNPDTCGCEVQR